VEHDRTAGGRSDHLDHLTELCRGVVEQPDVQVAHERHTVIALDERREVGRLAERHERRHDRDVQRLDRIGSEPALVRVAEIDDRRDLERREPFEVTRRHAGERCGPEHATPRRGTAEPRLVAAEITEVAGTLEVDVPNELGRGNRHAPSLDDGRPNDNRPEVNRR
jgi:hypothetical protein